MKTHAIAADATSSLNDASELRLRNVSLTSRRLAAPDHQDEQNGES
jgi:hypothetical protein